MTAEDHDLLQQYFDGELSPEERAEVQKLLDASEEYRARLAHLERLEKLVSQAADDAAGDIDSDALYSRIEAGIKSGKSMGPMSLIAIDGGQQQRPRQRRPEAWRVAVPTVALLAAAAVIVVILAGPDEIGGLAADERADHRGVTQEDIGEVTIEEDVAIVELEAPQGSEVEEVDFGHNTGTVFAVEGEAGEPIAVVWISDEPTEAMQ